MGAGDVAHRETEDRADHVVDRVDLADDGAFVRQAFPNEPNGPVGEVHFLLIFGEYEPV